MKKLHGKGVALKVMNRIETWKMRGQKRHKLVIMEVECGCGKKSEGHSAREDSKVFGHVGCMKEE